MPMRPPKHDPHARLRAAGIPVHTPKARPSGRDADPRRTIPLNSAAWRKLRAAVLAEAPLCLMCDDVATNVDHADGNPGNNTRRNLASLCQSCHSHKTVRERAGLPVIWGCTVEGWPRDPNHGWNVAKKSPETEATETARPPSLQRNGRG